MINIWQAKSGVHWDDKMGCDISPEMEGVCVTTQLREVEVCELKPKYEVGVTK